MLKNRGTLPIIETSYIKNYNSSMFLLDTYKRNMKCSNKVQEVNPVIKSACKQLKVPWIVTDPRFSNHHLYLCVHACVCLICSRILS